MVGVLSLYTSLYTEKNDLVEKTTDAFLSSPPWVGSLHLIPIRVSDVIVKGKGLRGELTFLRLFY